MCIRDRYSAGPLTEGTGLNLTFWSYAGQMNLGAIACKKAPVSYTHLRAHETVLDIVCRLLLEKKKTIEHTGQVDHTHTN